MRKRATPIEASFVDVMECLPVSSLPEGPEWTYEIKFDGYRMEAVVNHGKPLLLSRKENPFNAQYPSIVEALTYLPDATILDGEIIAVDEHGRPDFNLLQNFREAQPRIRFGLFDCLMYQGQSLLKKPIEERRETLRKIVRTGDRLMLSAVARSLTDIEQFARAHGLEGIVAKRQGSIYEPGQRSGAWMKRRFDLAQEFVVGGFTPGSNGFDSLVIGVYEGRELHFVARVRAGFVPASRRQVFGKLASLKVEKCPFGNLPEKSAGRFGEGLTAEKMKSCVWVKPSIVIQVKFLAWTEGGKLRHTSFVALREDKDPGKVIRET